MKYCLCIICIAAFVLAMGTTPLHAQDRLVLGFGGEATELQPILSARILTEAYGRIGIEIEARGFPGSRSLAMANRGGIDGELYRGELNKDEVPNLIRIPVPIMYGEIVVFTKDVEFEVTGWDSLKPYTIGIQIGVKETETGTKGMHVEPVVNVKQLFMKLAAGRNDIVVLPQEQGMEALESLIDLAPVGVNPQALQEITLLHPPIQRDNLYHYLHSKHAALVPKITAVLQEMEEEGLIQRIKEELETEVFE